jgi:DNA-binding beta-propeller fold protein YncE
MHLELMRKIFALGMAVIFSADLPASTAEEKPLLSQPPIQVMGTTGRFDYLSVDESNRRLLADHPENGSFDIFDLDSGKLIRSLPLGAAQGAAYDSRHNRYYVTLSKQQKVVAVDAASFQTLAEIPLSGPADGILFSPATGLLYAGHDDANEVWIINSENNKIQAAATLDGEGPEGAAIDDKGVNYFQNVKKANAIELLDGANGKNLKSWPTAPAENPHGLAYDQEHHHLLVAGGNGKFVILDDMTGKVLSSFDMAPNVDQIAFDGQTGRAYCPSGRTGTVTVIQISGDKAELLGVISVHKGAHTIALDPKTDAVWIAYGGKEGSYFQKLTAP